MENLHLVGYFISYLAGVLVGGIIVWRNRKKYILHLIATAKVVGVKIEEIENGIGVTVKRGKKK